MSDQPPPALRPDHPLFGLGYSRPVRDRAFERLDGAVVSSGDAPVAEEVPVAFVYNQRPHVVMMATPDDFEDFAAGFSLSEEVVRLPNDVQRVEVVRHGQGVELQITVPAADGERLATRGRQLAGRTGCGLCGVETISEALREPRTVTWREPVDPAALWRAEAELGARQEYNRATGAMHAAAWCTFDGAIRVVREDVGRHNALDKVIGALARERVDASTGFLIMTSRASYELVQKAAVAGIPLLAAVSRPTGLAIRLADAANLTLIGLLRGRTANVYAHPEHIRGAQAGAR
ncbi:MAG TPA: formate dehydrogenase accessory sulfurtransferase FdhD [Gemmatimonadaceae bacterium]